MFVKCKRCKGSGKYNYFGDKIEDCADCKGEGGFEIPEKTELCPKCGGTKVIPKHFSGALPLNFPCPRCLGDGYVPKH